jgi:DNA adenine methylase
MINKFWNKFNIATKDHFYHNGGNLQNRRTVVEALVCNFDIKKIRPHNHGMVEKNKFEQLPLQL